jgi:predicted ATPase/DNA-binding XRE family transcriptional regulator
MRHHERVGGEGSFGVRLRQLREAAGLTQEQLAERAGLSAKAVSLLERGERRRPYPHTVTSLADALGLAPAERADLLASVRRDASPPSTPGWPHPPTPLVGRDRELREVTELLGDQTTRLVTLTGTGGVGKTRLALGVLEAAVEAFPDGVVFVPLAPVTAPDLVLPTVVRALELTEAGREPREVLRTHLARRRTLLVLDNLEHLREAATDVSWLLGVSQAVVLVTSRAPLHVRGEREYAVAPLWSPATDAPSVEAVLGSPAGRLFADRARAVSPGFDLTEENAADVAAICRHLSGLPLALEIVAARTRFLGPAQLLSRLDRALQDEGARDLPERHRTLRRTLDWSHDLLEDADRELFARLSVFAGGFTLEAAEAVGGPGTLTSLGQLVDQSLVLAEPVSAGEVRFRMLEPVRQYAAERLADCGALDAVRAAHAEHFLALAEEAHPRIEGSEQIAWLDRLALENDNLRGAIAWGVESGRIDVAVRLGWALRMYWLMRGRREEGRLLMEQALRDADGLTDQLRARLLNVVAVCHYGFQASLRAMAEESLALFRRAGDRQGEGYALGMLGFADLEEGDLDEATQVLQEALEIAAELDDDWNAGHLLDHLAVIPLRTGDHERAADLAGQALARARRTGDRLAQQTSLQVLAQAAWAAGDHETARRHFRASLSVAAELADVVNVAYCLRGLALADGSRGGSVWAARLMGAADHELQEAGLPLFAWAVGDLDEAAAEAGRAASDDEAWRAAYDEGRVMGLDEASDLALEPR